MIKKFYVFAWLLLVGSVLFSVLSGALNGLQLVTFSLMSLALVYAFALWAVLGNTSTNADRMIYAERRIRTLDTEEY